MEVNVPLDLGEEKWGATSKGTGGGWNALENPPGPSVWPRAPAFPILSGTENEGAKPCGC